MATKPILNLPQWASSEPVGTNVIEPTSRKTTGYTKNLQGIPEKPTYQELNFLLKSNFEWTQYLEGATDEINEFTITAGENLTANDVIRVSGGQAFKADNTSSAGVSSIVGFVTQTISSGQTATIATNYWDGFSGLSVGAVYYVGSNGAITTTKPFNYERPLGVAVSSNRIDLNVGQEPTTYQRITRTVNFSVGGSNKYALFNGSNGTWRTSGTLHIASNNNSRGDAVYAFGYNSFSPSSSITAVYVNGYVNAGFAPFTGVGTANSLYVDVPGGGTFDLVCTYKINGIIPINNLLENPVII